MIKRITSAEDCRVFMLEGVESIYKHIVHPRAQETKLGTPLCV